MLDYKTHPLSHSVTILPNDWPRDHQGLRPGDFNQFANKGLGLSVPITVRPWDHFEEAIERPSYYGSEPQVAHPILNAPVNDSSGGCVYTDGRIDSEFCEKLLVHMGVSPYSNEYAVFLCGALDVLTERFLHQMRVISTYALSSVFGIEKSVVEQIDPQPQSAAETICTFVRLEQDMWGTGMNGNLAGAAGGDGDFAKEALGFGFLVENGFQGIARAWSRAWLVTK